MTLPDVHERYLAVQMATRRHELTPAEVLAASPELCGLTGDKEKAAELAADKLARYELTPDKMLTAAYELARDVALLAFALREDAPARRHKVVADNTRTALRRTVYLSAPIIDDAVRLILPTRTAAFRSGGKTASTAHKTAWLLGWRCRETTPEDDWPDKDELLNELDVEYALAMATLTGDEQRGDEDKADKPKAKRKTGRPRTNEKNGDILVIAALTKHHRYENGTVGNYVPATCDGLKKEFNKDRKSGDATISKASLSRFLRNVGLDGKKYQAACHDEAKLRLHLAEWNNELMSHHAPIRDDD